MPRVLRGKPDKNPKLRIREYDDTGNFWAGMRNVEAGLGRGEGGSERIREDPRGLGKGGWS